MMIAARVPPHLDALARSQTAALATASMAREAGAIPETTVKTADVRALAASVVVAAIPTTTRPRRAAARYLARRRRAQLQASSSKPMTMTKKKQSSATMNT